MFERPGGRIYTRSALVRLLPPEHTPTPLALTDLFARELDDYAEIIVGRAGRPVGFMTHADGPGFTERGRVALEQLGMPADALAHHSAMAELFEHRRAFLKLEWLVTDSGVEPAASCYFRRRPALAAVLERLAGWGVAPAALALARDVAAALDKSTVHFVAAAFRPHQPVQHKLYFSQLVARDTRTDVAARIERVLARADLPEPVRAHWRAHHDATLPPGESSLFVSLAFSGNDIAPWLKIDYPQVPCATAGAWLLPPDQARAVADAELACALARTSMLTYLGVRFHADRAAPSLKYYCDVPDPATRAARP
jgi:hypothetical protein